MPNNHRNLFFSFFIGICFTFGQQQYAAEVEQIDPLKKFQYLESPAEKLTFFLKTKEPYKESSGYDWLETINVYLDSAYKTKDTFQIKLYELLEAKVFSDLKNYNKSLTLVKGLFAQRDSLPKQQQQLLLEVLDSNYGGLRMYDRQIEIRQLKRQLGFSNQIQFYDIYANMGMYRRAMEDFIDDVASTLKEDDYLSKAAYHNTIGNYLRLDGSAATAIIEFNKAKGFLDVYINEISIEKTKTEILESEILSAIIEGNIGKSMVDMNKYSDAMPFLKESLAKLNAKAKQRERAEIIDNSLFLADAHLKLKENTKAFSY